MENSNTKSATQILYEYGIDIMSLNDDFNSQLLHAMEDYAAQFKEQKPSGVLDLINSEYKRLDDIDPKTMSSHNNFKRVIRKGLCFQCKELIKELQPLDESTQKPLTDKEIEAFIKREALEVFLNEGQNELYFKEVWLIAISMNSILKRGIINAFKAALNNSK